MKLTSAFVLGAGLGTRLKALTQERPKPLIPVGNKPLITYAFDHLMEVGITRFVVNTHWRAEVYPVTFPGGFYRGASVEFRHESPLILETAGGIKNAEELIGHETFIVYNGDIFTDLPLAPALRAHAESGNEVTLILRSKDGPLQVSFDHVSGRITDIGKRIDTTSPAEFLFTGIYIVEPSFFKRIPAATKLSVIPVFLDMIREGANLGGIVLDEGQWWDLGTREQYLAVHSHLVSGRSQWIDPSARIAASAQITGATAIGAGVVVGANTTLHDCIVWEGASIAEGSLLNQCVITAGAQVSGIHSHADL
ncbi:MAG: Nucleotidyl transferase [Chthoniobacteraceae bacterium]|nr:Nucleotidyl transferase [Chthoniobacteraceae bacterium]